MPGEINENWIALLYDSVEQILAPNSVDLDNFPWNMAFHVT